MARVAKPSPRFLSRLRALGILPGTPATRALAREVRALVNADVLPAPLDYEAAIPPTSKAWVRRVSGENMWIFYAWDANHVVLLTVMRTPPVPIT